MSTFWNWPGSRWWRIDLHTHSPASYDFKPEADRNARDWSAWVAAAKSAGLDAVALTDHNTPDGIAEVQSAAASAGSLTVFPGVEVTVGGIHLLCVLDPKCTRDDVVALLANLGIVPSMFGLDHAASSKSILEAIEIATAASAVVVAAHVNAPKGLVMLEAAERYKALKDPKLAAAELVTMPTHQPAGWFDPMGDLVQQWLDGTKTDGRRLTQVWSSDSHELAQAGRAFTWVKMTRPDLDGLRLALLDGDGSVQKPASGRDPNAHAGHVIESIRVVKAKYMGFAEEFSIEFNPWLNAIIGGRGTGKSTLVDLCRRALRRDDELGETESSELRDAFEKRMSVSSGRSDEGLLKPETLVEVVYRKDGDRFAVSWNAQSSATPVTRLDGERRTPENGDIQERFPVRIYSQKQLFDLAKDPNALLTVIDDSGEVRGTELGRRRKEAETKYLSLCADARALRAQAAELPARGAALADVRRKIEVLQAGGHAKGLNDYRVRRRQDGTWEAVGKAATDGMEAVRRTLENLAVAELELGVSSEGTDATAALRRAHAQVRAIVGELRKNGLDAVSSARSKLDAVQGGSDVAAWRAVVAESEREYKQLTEQLAQAGIANPDEYRELLQRATTLEQEIEELKQRQLTAESREGDAFAELARVRDLRGELTRNRKAFGAKTSGDLIKVEIQAYADRDGLDAFLRNALGVPRFEKDYRAVVDRLPGAEEQWEFQKLDALVAELRAVLADPQKQWPTEDRRFEVALRGLQPERLDRLALYLPDDAVDVSFRDAANHRWRKLAHGSPGQQTAALLAFVLGYGHEPIILDQPEDDLDNTLIYELLVKRLRETKQTRQVIVVTHNSNIVVHGDAELVVSLEAASGQTKTTFAGGLQEQKARDEICRVMEGGRDAFETRYRRIMHPGTRRNG